MNITLEVIERVTKIGVMITGIILLIHGILEKYSSTGLIGGGFTFISLIGFLKESLDLVKIAVEKLYSKIDKKRFLLIEPNNIIEH